MIYQALIGVDSALDVLSVDAEGNYTVGNDVVRELATMQAEWAEIECPDGGHMMPGTRVDKGRKVLYVLLDIVAEDPLALLNSTLISYDLDWVVWTLQTVGKFLVVDALGDPVLDGDGNIQYKPISEMPLGSGFIDFVADLPGGGRPTAPLSLHSYAGLPKITLEP